MLTSAMSPEAVTAAVERIRDGRGAARLRRPRALHERPLPRRDRRGRRRPPGRRRGPLPLGVGPRLPPRLPAAGRRAGASGLSADHRADGDGDAAGGGRHRDGAPAPRPGDAADGLRSPQPHVRRRPGGRRPRQAARARLAAARARRASGRRLLRPPAHVRGGGRCAVSRRAACVAVPRRARQRPAIRHADGLPRRGARCRVRDDRLRHGHRQGGRPLGRPLGAPGLAGGVLPAGRPRRPRRAAGALHAALCTARQGPDRLLHQPREAGPDRPDRRASRPSRSGPTTGACSGCASEISGSTSLASALAVLERAGALELFPAPAGSFAGRVADARLSTRHLAAAVIAGRRVERRRWDRLKAIDAYATSGDCRRAALLGYFADAAVERAPDRCCDVCGAAVVRLPDAEAPAPMHAVDVDGRRGAARRRRDRRDASVARASPRFCADRAGGRSSRPATTGSARTASSQRSRPTRCSGRRLADRLRRARADRRPVPAGAQAGRGPGRDRPRRRAARPGQGARPARDREGIPFLARVLAAAEDAELRALAAEALGAIGGERAAAALRTAAPDHDPSVAARRAPVR